MTGLDALEIVADYTKESVTKEASKEIVGLVDRPDFGWRFAKYLAGLGRHARLPWGAKSRWIRIASIFLQRETPFESPSSPEIYTVDLALAVYERKAKRCLLNAFLLCEDADYEEIGRYLKMDMETVEAYHDLFFSVTGRDSSFVDRAAWDSHPIIVFEGSEYEDEGDEISSLPIMVGRFGSMFDVALASRIKRLDGDEGRDTGETLQKLCKRFHADCEPSEVYVALRKKKVREAELWSVEHHNPHPANELVCHMHSHRSSG